MYECGSGVVAWGCDKTTFHEWGYNLSADSGGIGSVCLTSS